MGPGVEISGGSAANTIVGVASFGGTGRVHRAGPRRPARRRLRARHPRAPACTFESPPATDGPSRPAAASSSSRPTRERTMNTYLGASARARTRATSTPTLIARARGHVPRGLPLGRARRQGGVPPRGAHRARRRQRGVAHALRLVLRRAPPRRVPRARRGRQSTCCSPTRPRSRALYEVDDFDDALQTRRRATARSPRSPAARRAR